MSFVARLLRRKLTIWTLLLLPGLWPIWPFYIKEDINVTIEGALYVVHHLGFTASVLLAIVLTFTPLRVLFPKSEIVQALNRHRRLVGVSSFAYGLVHFGTHLYYEGGFAKLGHTLQTDFTKPFLITGMVALTILLVLAVTSLNSAIRWLGGKVWKNLHRLVYLAAALVVYHQSAARKVFPVQVLWIFVPLAALELARIIKQQAKARGKPVPA